MKNVILSIVIPVYKAEKIVKELVNQVSSAALKITDDYEIILVDDFSPDMVWENIKIECNKNAKVKGIQFSRNFGQHYAISAGLSYSKGNHVVVMDCDLQDDPKYIQELYEKQLEGYDIVYTTKQKRAHSAFKNITANIFNKVFNYLIENKEHKGKNDVGSYSMLSRKVVDSYLKIHDYRRHYLMILRWLGFHSAYVEVVHSKRFEGKSSYTLKKLIDHALDGITSHTDKLLRLTVSVGLLMSFVAFCGVFGIILKSFYIPFQIGWPSLAVLILLTSGITTTCVGICGLYIGRIFEQTKNRPLYIVQNEINTEKDQLK